MAQRDEIARLAAELTRMRDDLSGTGPNYAQTLKAAAADGT
jgi:hypothetical protein